MTYIYNTLQSIFAILQEENKKNIVYTEEYNIPVSNNYYSFIIDPNDEDYKSALANIRRTDIIEQNEVFKDDNISISTGLIEEEQIYDINIINKNIKELGVIIDTALGSVSESSSTLHLIIDIDFLLTLFKQFYDKGCEIHVIDFIIYKFKNKADAIYIYSKNNMINVNSLLYKEIINMLVKEVTDTHEKDVTNTHEKEVTDTPEKDVTDTPEKDVTNTHEKDVTDTPEKDVTDTPEKEVTNTHEKEVTDTPEKDVTNTHEKDVTNTHEKDVTNTHEKEVSNNNIYTLYKNINNTYWYLDIKDDDEDSDTPNISIDMDMDINVISSNIFNKDDELYVLNPYDKNKIFV